MGNNLFKVSGHTGQGHWLHEHNMVIVFLLSLAGGLTGGCMLWSLYRCLAEIRLNDARLIRHRASKQLNSYYAARLKHNLPTICEKVESSTLNPRDTEDSKTVTIGDKTTVMSLHATVQNEPLPPPPPSPAQTIQSIQANPTSVGYPISVDKKQM